MGGQQPRWQKAKHQLLKEVFKENLRVTVRMTAETFDLSYGSAQEIMTSKMEMIRVCARWVPRLLLNMGLRVTNCLEILKRFELKELIFTDRIITCDETWVRFYESESKKQNNVWQHSFSPSPVEVKACRQSVRLCV